MLPYIIRLTGAGWCLTFGIADMAMWFVAPCVYAYVIDSHETLWEKNVQKLFLIICGVYTYRAQL